MAPLLILGDNVTSKRQQKTARLFWFVSVPIVLAWVSFASLAVYQSVVNQQMITENQILVIGIVGGPALLIITNILDLYKQETTTDIDNMTPRYIIDAELAKMQLAHDLEMKSNQHKHVMEMEKISQTYNLMDEE